MDTRDDAPNGDYSAIAKALKALQDTIDNTASDRRRLEALGTEATDEQLEATLASARSAFATLYRDYGRRAEAAPVVTLADLAGSYWDEVKKRRQGIGTGLADLDEAIGDGLQPGKLAILLGAPGSGKTTLANQIAEHVASAGRPVFYMTSEDTPGMLLAKTIARLYKIPYSAVLSAQEDYQDKIYSALEEVSKRPSARRLAYLHYTGRQSLEQIQEQTCAHFRRYADETTTPKGGPGVLVVDYLQRLARSLRRTGGRADDLKTAVSELTDQFRAFAVEADCTVLVLASQNRAGYGSNGAGALASAKESGDVEYDADLVLALAPDEKGKAAPGHKPILLHLAKNRLGPSGEPIKLDWYGKFQEFTKGGQV